MNLQTDAFLWLKGAGVLKETNPQPSRTHPGQVLLSAHANHGFETGQKVGEMLNLILRERGLQLPGESFQNFQKLSSPSSKAQNWNAISDLLRQHLRVELDEQAIPHILNGQSPGVVSQLVNELYDMQKEWKTEQSQNGSKSFPRPRKRMEGYRRKLALLKKSGFAQKTSSPPNITAFTPHSVTNRHHFCASRCASHEPPSGSGRSSPLRGILKTLRDPPGDPPSTPPTQKAHVAPSSLLHPPDIPTTSMTSSPYKSLNFNHQSHAPPAVSAAVASAAAAAASAAAATVSSFHSQHHLQRGTSFSPHEREDNFAPPDVSAHMHPSVYAPQLTTPRHPRPTNTPSQCHCGGGGDSPPFPRVAASSKSVAASRERVGVSGLAEPLRRGSSSSFEEPSAGLGGLAVASSAGAYALYGSSAFRSNAAAPLASAGASAPLPLPAASQLPSSPTRSFHTIPQTSRGPSSFPLQSQTSTHASRGRHSLPPIERQGTMQQSDAATAASLVPFSSLAPESPNLRFGSAKMSFNSRAVPDNPTSNASQAPPIRSALLPARLPAPPVASGWGASSDGRTSRAMQTDENFFVHGGSSQEKSSKVVTSKNSEVQQEEGGLLPAEDGVEVLTSEVDPVTSKARSTEAFLVLTLASSLQLGEADAEGWLRGNGRELGEAFESSGGNWAVCGNRGVDLREWLAALSGSFQQLCELIVEDPSTLFGALCIVEQGLRSSDPECARSTVRLLALMSSTLARAGLRENLTVWFREAAHVRRLFDMMRAAQEAGAGAIAAAGDPDPGVGTTTTETLKTLSAGASAATTVVNCCGQSLLQLVADDLKVLFAEARDFLVAVHAFCKCLLTGGSKEEGTFNAMWLQGAGEYLLEYACLQAQNGQSMERRLAASFLAVDLCAVFAHLMAESGESLMNRLMQATRKCAMDANRASQLLLFPALFNLLDELCARHSPLTPIVYRSLIFAIVETGVNGDGNEEAVGESKDAAALRKEEEAQADQFLPPPPDLTGIDCVRDLLLSSMLGFVENTPGVPIAPLLEPLSAQIRSQIRETGGASRGGEKAITLRNFELLIVIAKHPRLSVRSALLIVDLCGEIALNDEIFGRTASLPMNLALSRYAEDSEMAEWVQRFVKVALTILVQQTNAEGPRYSLAVETLGKLLLTVQQKNINLAAVVRALVLDMCKAVFEEHGSLLVSLQPIAQLFPEEVEGIRLECEAVRRWEQRRQAEEEEMLAARQREFELSVQNREVLEEAGVEGANRAPPLSARLPPPTASERDSIRMDVSLSLDGSQEAGEKVHAGENEKDSSSGTEEGKIKTAQKTLSRKISKKEGSKSGGRTSRAKSKGPTRTVTTRRTKEQRQNAEKDREEEGNRIGWEEPEETGTERHSMPPSSRALSPPRSVAAFSSRSAVVSSLRQADQAGSKAPGEAEERKQNGEDREATIEEVLRDAVGVVSASQPQHQEGDSNKKEQQEDERDRRLVMENLWRGLDIHLSPHADPASLTDFGPSDSERFFLDLRRDEERGAWLLGSPHLDSSLTVPPVDLQVSPRRRESAYIRKTNLHPCWPSDAAAPCLYPLVEGTEEEAEVNVLLSHFSGTLALLFSFLQESSGDSTGSSSVSVMGSSEQKQREQETKKGGRNVRGSKASKDKGGKSPKKASTIKSAENRHGTSGSFDKLSVLLSALSVIPSRATERQVGILLDRILQGPSDGTGRSKDAHHMPSRSRETPPSPPRSPRAPHQAPRRGSRGGLPGGPSGSSTSRAGASFSLGHFSQVFLQIAFHAFHPEEATRYVCAGVPVPRPKTNRAKQLQALLQHVASSSASSTAIPRKEGEGGGEGESARLLHSSLLASSSRPVPSSLNLQKVGVDTQEGRDRDAPSEASRLGGAFSLALADRLGFDEKQLALRFISKTLGAVNAMIETEGLVPAKMPEGFGIRNFYKQETRKCVPPSLPVTGSFRLCAEIVNELLERVLGMEVLDTHNVIGVIPRAVVLEDECLCQEEFFETLEGEAMVREAELSMGATARSFRHGHPPFAAVPATLPVMSPPKAGQILETFREDRGKRAALQTVKGLELKSDTGRGKH